MKGTPASSAVLTVVLADLRGYTRFTAEHGDEAAAAVSERFASLAEDAAGRHGGRVVELRGDEIFAVFASAREAIRAALELQDRVEKAREDGVMLPAGIGLDAGDLVSVRDGFRGAAVNLAARLCALAGPGDVFATQGVVHLARKLDGVRYVDRGSVRLKGLDAPVPVIQVVPGVRVLDVPLAPLQTVVHEPANNLPDAATPFVGREVELTELASLLRDSARRLVTVTGPGGIGKTRLALQAGAMVLHDYPDGVFLVPLAPVSDPAFVPDAIAQALGIRQSGRESVVELLGAHLRNRHLLLILDNMEHVVESCGIVAGLLNSCRALHVLVSSRAVLRLAREYEFGLLPLGVPEDASVPPDVLLRSDAVRLFVDRARATSGRFELTDANAAAVAGICVRLEGLPLALELAASRVRLFPPRALLDRISTRLLELTGGARDLPERQQTLRGTIDWSFNLLSEPEQRLFLCLSVFAGGCTLEAAEVVAGADARAGDVVDGVLSLVEKSLLRQDGDEEPRFGMLEILREYGRERLRVTGLYEDRRRAHAEYYLGLAEEASGELRGSRQKEWMDLLDVEHDNLRAAMQYCLESRTADWAVRYVDALRWFWLARGHLTEGRRWLDEALALPDDAAPTSRAGALSGAGTLAMAQADYQRAEERYSEGLVLLRALGDAAAVAMAFNNLGVVAEQQGRYQEAAALYEDALNALQAGDERWRIALVTGNLGGVLAYLGEYERSIALCEESLNLRREQGDALGAIHALNTLVFVLLERGSVERAAAHQRESLALCRDEGIKESLTVSLEGAAKVAAAQHHLEEAARLWGAAARLRETLAQPLSPVGLEYQERYVGLLRAELGVGEVDRLWALGAALNADDATDLALDTIAEAADVPVADR